MKLPSFALVVLAASAALLCGVTSAASQPVEFPPAAGGLFGGSDQRLARHKLDLTVSLVGAHDRDVPAELSDIGGSDVLSGRDSMMLMGSTEYRWQGSRVQVGAAGETVLRRYTRLQQVRAVNYSAGVGVSVRLGHRTTLVGNQNVAYSPSYLYRLFPREAPQAPGDAVPTAADYGVSDTASYFYGTTVTLARGLTRRSRVAATGELSYTHFLHAAATRPDVNLHGMRGEFSHNLSRHTAVQVAYRYRAGEFAYTSAAADTERNLLATEHGLDAGFEYTRPLSATRRMIVDVRLGSSAVTPSTAADDGMESGLHRFSSDIGVAWQFKTWQVRGSFQRTVEYVAELGEPVFSDGFTAEVAGLITSRLDWIASARSSAGASARHRDDLTLDTYGADFRIRYALGRSVAIYGGYLYYFYDLRGGTRLAPGLPRNLERNGMRLGLTFWVPAVRR